MYIIYFHIHMFYVIYSIISIDVCINIYIVK